MINFAQEFLGMWNTRKRSTPPHLLSQRGKVTAAAANDVEMAGRRRLRISISVAARR